MHHPFHPVSRVERLFIFIGDFAFGYFWTLVVVAALGSDTSGAETQKLTEDVKDAFQSGNFKDLKDSVQLLGSVSTNYASLAAIAVVQSVWDLILWKVNVIKYLRAIRLMIF